MLLKTWPGGKIILWPNLTRFQAKSHLANAFAKNNSRFAVLPFCWFSICHPQVLINTYFHTFDWHL
jgi:hypothetical protein